MLQIILICSKFFDGTLTIFEFPDNKPKINEYAKLVGIFDGVIWYTNPKPILFVLVKNFVSFLKYFVYDTKMIMLFRSG